MACLNGVDNSKSQFQTLIIPCQLGKVIGSVINQSKDVAFQLEVGDGNRCCVPDLCENCSVLTAAFTLNLDLSVATKRLAQCNKQST